MIQQTQLHSKTKYSLCALFRPQWQSRTGRNLLASFFFWYFWRFLFYASL